MEYIYLKSSNFRRVKCLKTPTLVVSCSRVESRRYHGERRAKPHPGWVASDCKITSQTERWARHLIPSHGCIALIPSHGCIALIPSHGCTALVPSPGCTALVPSPGCTALVPSHGCTALVPSHGCTAPVPSHGCTALAPSPDGCTAPVPSPGCIALVPSPGCIRSGSVTWLHRSSLVVFRVTDSADSRPGATTSGGIGTTSVGATGPTWEAT